MTAVEKPVAGGDTSWFTQGRLGLMLHMGLYSVAGIEASWPLVQGLISYDEYAALAGAFNPQHYDPAAWAALAKEAGARYVVFTTKHHDGFSLFDTKLSDFSSVRTAAGRDLIRPYVEAVRAAGLRVGLYFSLPDWHHVDYPVVPTPLGSRPEKAWPPNVYHDIAAEPDRWQRYLVFMRGQLEELLTGYGAIDLLWFDGGWEQTLSAWNGYDLIRQIRQWQPGIIMNDRLNPSLMGVANTLDLGVSDYIQCEMALPAPTTSLPWERAMTINDSWSYKPVDVNYKSATTLLHYLVGSVAQGGTLLVDVGPSADGEIQGDFASRLRVIGAWLRRNGASVYGCGSAGLPPTAWRDPLTRDGSMLYVHVFGAPPDDLVEVSDLTERVLEATVLATGEPLEWSQQIAQYFGSFLRLRLPAAYRDPYDTVIALRLG